MIGGEREEIHGLRPDQDSKDNPEVVGMDGTASGFGKVCNWDELSVMVVAGLAMALARFRCLALLRRLALLG
jgi:hypothetical protein